MASANKRGCRCGGSETSPGGQEAAGLPRGYCGLCVMCSKPGHSRHHPGAVRFTGAWCDFHYRVLAVIDRKSTRLNSSHRCISYAVFCLKKKTTNSTCPSAP